MEATDAVVVGAGVNGLVCALVLARAGLDVRVVEGQSRSGGAFGAAPCLGFVPHEIQRVVGVALPLRPRDPAVFVPTTNAGQFLLAGPGPVGLADAIAKLSPVDGRGVDVMHAELDALTSDLAPAWNLGLLAPEDVAERFVRPTHRDAFIGLCRESLTAYLDRFGIANELVRAFFAVDTLCGAFTSPDAPGSAAPLLVRHAARTTGGGGDAVADAAVVAALETAVKAAGVAITFGNGVTRIAVEGNTAAGVVLADGSTVRASTVVSSTDPFALRALVGDEHLSTEYVRKIDGFARRGASARVTLTLAKLPAFASLAEDRGQHRAVIHLLSGGDHPLAAVRAAFADADAGRIPAAPPMTCVFEGTQATLTLPWMPAEPVDTTWQAEEERFVRGILTIVDSFAPGTSALVTAAKVSPPRGLPSHVDDTLVWSDRLAYATPIPGLYACGAGCAPAGGVFGLAGHNAAERVLADVELGLERTEVGRRPDDL